MSPKFIAIGRLLDALKCEKRGTLREAHSDETPDFIQERDKLSTGITFVRGGGGFSVMFARPIQLIAGRGYVFVEGG